MIYSTIIRDYVQSPVGDAVGQIFITTPAGKCHAVLVRFNDTVKTLKTKIGHLWGIPIHEQRLLFSGRQLDDRLTFQEYGINDKSSVQLVLRLRGGVATGLVTANFEAPQINGIGTPAFLNWEGYAIGMNFHGTCSKKCCLSKNGITMSQDGTQVIRAAYGVIKMNKQRGNRFFCPACKEIELPGMEGTLVPKNFVLSFGRSLIKYKKSGASQPVKFLLMESFGLNNEFKTFGEGAPAEYDFIEITTVPINASPFNCAKCGYNCEDPKGKSQEREVILQCGHGYHRACVPSVWAGCMICKTEVLHSIGRLLNNNNKETTDNGMAFENANGFNEGSRGGASARRRGNAYMEMWVTTFEEAKKLLEKMGKAKREEYGLNKFLAKR